MPWIDKNKWTGCGACITICPVKAIAMKEGKAEIDMDKCIRCGKCHDVCPVDAIRHDSEKIPIEVEQNLEKMKKLMGYYKTETEKKAFIERIIKYFNKEKKVAEKTIEKIKEKFK